MPRCDRRRTLDMVTPLFAIMALALGCSSSPEPAAACQADTDCPAGQVCRDGTCSTTLALSLSSPADRSATNGTVHVA